MCQQSEAVKLFLSLTESLKVLPILHTPLEDGLHVKLHRGIK